MKKERKLLVKLVNKQFHACESFDKYRIIFKFRKHTLEADIIINSMSSQELIDEAGKGPGLEIWRIEEMELALVPRDQEKVQDFRFLA